MGRIARRGQVSVTCPINGPIFRNNIRFVIANRIENRKIKEMKNKIANEKENITENKIENGTVSGIANRLDTFVFL